MKKEKGRINYKSRDKQGKGIINEEERNHGSIFLMTGGENRGERFNKHKKKREKKSGAQ